MLQLNNYILSKSRPSVAWCDSEACRHACEKNKQLCDWIAHGYFSLKNEGTLFHAGNCADSFLACFNR